MLHDWQSDKYYCRESKEILEKEQDMKKELKEECEHDCHDNAQYYEFTEDNQRYHGWECSKCGELLQTG